MIFQVQSYTGFNSYQADKIERALKILRAVYADERFRHLLDAAKLSETRNEKALEFFGKEFDRRPSLGGYYVASYLIHHATTHPIRLRRYCTWKTWSKVVGYVQGGNTIHCNAKYWDVASDVSNAGFLAHEHSHIAGFSHSSAKAHNSVPYSLNRVVAQVWGQIREKQVERV